MEKVGNRQQFLQAIGSNDSERLKAASEYLQRLEKLPINDNQDRTVLLNSLRLEVLNAFLNYQLDKNDCPPFFPKEIERLREILNK